MLERGYVKIVVIQMIENNGCFIFEVGMLGRQRPTPNKNLKLLKNI